MEKARRKEYNSRFTSNTETVSRVACYLYIKATWKLAASLAYGIHRSIYRLFLSFPLHSFLDEFLIFPPPPPPPFPLPSPCLFYSRYALVPIVFTIRRTGHYPPHLRSFRSIFAPPLPPLPPPPSFPLPQSRTPRQRIIYWASFSTGNLCWPQSCHARENGGNINSRGAEGAFELECLQNVSKRS